MGDGKRLKEIIDEKGTNIFRVSMATGISSQTLYSIVKKDSHVRYDYAVLLGKHLDIDPKEICSAVPFSNELTEDEVYYTIHDSTGLLDKNRVKTYVKSSMLPLLQLFGKVQIVDLHKLMTSFYMLDDEARKEVVDTIQLKLKYHTDPKRADEVKNLKPY